MAERTEATETNQEAEATRRRFGRAVYGAAAIALGIVGLLWGDFATVWQPVPEEVPYRKALAYAAAALLLISGIALQDRRTARAGATAPMLLYTIFALYWAKRVYLFPQLFGTWSGCAEQLALVLAAIVIWRAPAGERSDGTSRAIRACRIAFGLCVVSFGVAHFTAIPQTAAMVPPWLPPSQPFWAVATGIAHLLAGIALISGILAPLASRLLTAMFVLFGALVWAPSIFQDAGNHIVWGGNAINLALIGAAWVFADALQRQRPRTQR
ncbi:MAG TPA: DoxX family membrane protein [Allosphingosinicella sp.]